MDIRDLEAQWTSPRREDMLEREVSLFAQLTQYMIVEYLNGSYNLLRTRFPDLIPVMARYGFFEPASRQPQVQTTILNPQFVRVSQATPNHPQSPYSLNYSPFSTPAVHHTTPLRELNTTLRSAEHPLTTPFQQHNPSAQPQPHDSHFHQRQYDLLPPQSHLPAPSPHPTLTTLLNNISIHSPFNIQWSSLYLPASSHYWYPALSILYPRGDDLTERLRKLNRIDISEGVILEEGVERKAMEALKIVERMLAAVNVEVEFFKGSQLAEDLKFVLSVANALLFLVPRNQKEASLYATLQEALTHNVLEVLYLLKQELAYKIDKSRLLVEIITSRLSPCFLPSLRERQILLTTTDRKENLNGVDIGWVEDSKIGGEDQPAEYQGVVTWVSLHWGKDVIYRITFPGGQRVFQDSSEDLLVYSAEGPLCSLPSVGEIPPFSRYKGRFVLGVPWGEGVLELANGEIYKGDWRGGYLLTE